MVTRVNTASFWPMRRWSSFSKVPRSKDWFEINDRASSAEFAVWAPLLQGTPVLAREEFYWQAGQPD
jgi:hypothetical protein